MCVSPTCCNGMCECCLAAARRPMQQHTPWGLNTQPPVASSSSGMCEQTPRYHGTTAMTQTPSSLQLPFPLPPPPSAACPLISTHPNRQPAAHTQTRPCQPQMTPSPPTSSRTPLHTAPPHATRVCRAPVHLWVFKGVLNQLPDVTQHLINATQVGIVQRTRGCACVREEGKKRREDEKRREMAGEKGGKTGGQQGREEGARCMGWVGGCR